MSSSTLNLLFLLALHRGASSGVLWRSVIAWWRSYITRRGFNRLLAVRLHNAPFPDCRRRVVVCRNDCSCDRCDTRVRSDCVRIRHIRRHDI